MRKVLVGREVVLFERFRIFHNKLQNIFGSIRHSKVAVLEVVDCIQFLVIIFNFVANLPYFYLEGQTKLFKLFFTSLRLKLLPGLMLSEFNPEVIVPILDWPPKFRFVVNILLKFFIRS